MEAELVIKEGWAVKESGQVNFLGKRNWKRRWCRLVRNANGLTWAYYRKLEDIAVDQPAGRIELDSTYNARDLEVGERKQKPNCFALGPVFDNQAIRTYYVSCDSEDERLSWMECLTAVIEAGDHQALERDRRSIRRRLRRRSKNKESCPPWTEVQDSQPYLDPKWRLQQWKNLGLLIKSTQWKKSDTKNGVTVSRGSFKNNDYIITKVEGVIPVPPDITYDYIQQATQDGGKLDQVFRSEKVLQRVKGKFLDLCPSLHSPILFWKRFSSKKLIPNSIPHAEIVHNRYTVPLPSISPREVCLVRMWVPSYMSGDNRAGMLLWSATHPLMPGLQDSTKVQLDLSGFILSPSSEPDFSTFHTKAEVFVQIDLKDSLQSMMEGTYRSGLLKVGLRTAFTHISSQVEKYYAVIQG